MFVFETLFLSTFLVCPPIELTTTCGEHYVASSCAERPWFDGTTRLVRFLLPETSSERLALQVLEPRSPLSGQATVVTSPWLVRLGSQDVLSQLQRVEELEGRGYDVVGVEMSAGWDFEIRQYSSVADPDAIFHALAKPIPLDWTVGSQNFYMRALNEKKYDQLPFVGPSTLERIRAVAHSATSTSAKVSNRIAVAVVDTGIDRDHEDLADVLGEGFACGPEGCRSGPDIGQDVRGHGTRVAATIASERFGVAHGAARLLPVQVVDRQGCLWSDHLDAGLRFAVQQKARIVVMALDLPKEDAIVPAMEATRAFIDDHPNTLFIVAAGNNDREPLTAYWARGRTNMLVVGGIDHTKHPEVWHENWGDYIAIAAPAVDCTVSESSDSDNWAYRTDSGTTFATGYVAGVAARLLADEPNLTAAELRERLLATADCTGRFRRCGLYSNEPCCANCGVVDLGCALHPGSAECPRDTCSASEPPPAP